VAQSPSRNQIVTPPYVICLAGGILSVCKISVEADDHGAFGAISKGAAGWAICNEA
jgi:hypothetical protein